MPVQKHGIEYKVSTDTSEAVSNLRKFENEFRKVLEQMGKSPNEITAFEILAKEVKRGVKSTDTLDTETRRLLETYRTLKQQATDRDFLGLQSHQEVRVPRACGNEPGRSRIEELYEARHDDPIWRSWEPSAGYNCRCTTVALSEDEAKAHGLEQAHGVVLRAYTDPSLDVWPLMNTLARTLPHFDPLPLTESDLYRAGLLIHLMDDALRRLPPVEGTFLRGVEPNSLGGAVRTS